MTIKRWSAHALATLCDSDATELERALAEALISEGLGAPSAGERRSWRHSLPVLARDLRDAGLGGVEVIPEYRLPLSNKRADVVLAGVHPASGEPSYVVVELKQWSTARVWEGHGALVDVPGARYRPTLHPSVQVDGYAGYLRDFVTVLAERPESVVAAAYLHNVVDNDVEDLCDSSTVGGARLFTGQRRGEFYDFLRSRLSPASGVAAADRLLGSKIGPSKQLLALAADEIREREQFVLLDEQRVAYEMVLAEVAKAKDADRKTVVVVAGGPGSGKSVIALSLVGEIARQGRSVLHATGSKSFTSTLRKVAGKGSGRTRALFTYFNSFVTAEKNGLDVLVCDEAHRLREQSVNRFTPKRLRDIARPQIEELIDAARVPVFLLDQYQVVRPGEIGSVAEIENYATARGIAVREVNLNGQYRSGGSEAYIDWVLRLLGLREGGPVPWHDEPNFTVDVVDSPIELEARLTGMLNHGYAARMTAGYCWPWSDPRDDGSLVSDVRIGPWAKPWNLRSERAIGSVPPSSLWATEDGGFGQVGCVYTAQGFEYDWNGVILGDDFVWRTDRWVSRRQFNRDPDFRNPKRVPDEDFDRLVRHVYKVLLTRGMSGTLIFSTDVETQAMLRGVVNPRA